jgi:hypothetical protein
MTPGLEGGEWSAARPGRTLPPGKTRYPLYRGLGGPQGAKYSDNIKCQQSATGTVCVARLPQSYHSEPYQWILMAAVLLIAGYSQCVDKA